MTSSFVVPRSMVVCTKAALLAWVMTQARRRARARKEQEESDAERTRVREKRMRSAVLSFLLALDTSTTDGA